MLVSEYLMSCIAGLGVRCVFLVPGGGSMHMVDALGRSPDLTFCANHHEQASAIAAEAYGRVNGTPGVALVTTGPGATNTVTAIAGAWIDSFPLIVIAGHVKTADMIGDSGLRQRGPQEVDIVSMVTPITKYAAFVMKAEDVRFHMEKAIHLATSGRPGPVLLSVPLDVQAAEIDPQTLRGFEAPAESSRGGELAGQVSQVIEWLNAAERPLLMVGYGVRLARAVAEFVELHRILGIPVVTTWPAKDIIPPSDPLSMGSPGAVGARGPNFTVQNCDLLISVGARLDNPVTAYNSARFARAAKRVVVDVDAAELAKFEGKMELTIQADAGDFVRAFLAARNKVKHKPRAAWIERCQAWKVRYPAADGKITRPASGPISHFVFVDCLSEEVPENTLIVPGVSGLGIETFFATFRLKLGQRCVFNAGLGAMGYGLPAIVGAGMANGGKPFVGIEGDGSLQLNLQELAVLRGHNIPVRLFVINNNGYASIRSTQRNYFKGRYVATGPEAGLILPDIVEVAKAYGIPAMRIEDAGELVERVRHALAQPGPFICDVRLVHDEGLWPRSSAIIQPDGTMISMPLEDMSPLLPRDELRENMLVPLDPASEMVHPDVVGRKVT